MRAGPRTRTRTPRRASPTSTRSATTTTPAQSRWITGETLLIFPEEKLSRLRRLDCMQGELLWWRSARPRDDGAVGDCAGSRRLRDIAYIFPHAWCWGAFPDVLAKYPVIETPASQLFYHLNAIAQAFSMAELAGRSFFIDDSEWDRGKWTDHFQPLPDQRCAKPDLSAVKGCPRAARHWVGLPISSRCA